MSGNVTPLDPEQEGVGKTVATMFGELQELVDSYAGHINNAEAVGVLALQMIKTAVESLEEEQ